MVSAAATGPTSAKIYKWFINVSSYILFNLLQFNKTEDDSWRSYPEWNPPKWFGQGKTSLAWLEGRKAEGEGEKDLWRIHDDLYDLKDFIERHPGGAFWLESTKGTDITEAFECHHLSDNPRKMLSKFFVKKATTKRNSPFTFEENGFYSTLRRRVQEKLKGEPTGPSYQSKFIMDSFLTCCILFSVLAARNESLFYTCLAAIFLTGTTIIAHNFFHQRDTWRMYLFQLSLLSVRDWRISHAMSHHIYTNSLHDLEISLFEPWFQYLPRPDKSFAARYLAWFYWPIVYFLIFVGEGISRLMVNPDGLVELVPLVIPGSMVLCNVPILTAMKWWACIVMLSSFFFSCIGLNAAHHHPNIFHDGDEPRKDRDWGLYQLDTVKDRKEIKGVPVLVLTMFGDHTLHHMFPTIDHSRLDCLYPIFEQTCKEFNIDFKMTTIFDLAIGQFKQLARNTKRKAP